MSVVPLTPLLTSGLSGDEAAMVEALTDQSVRFAAPNMEANAYYEAKHILRWQGFSVPPDVASRVTPVVGASATVIDVLEERLDFLGWDDASPDADPFGLDEVY